MRLIFIITFTYFFETQLRLASTVPINLLHVFFFLRDIGEFILPPSVVLKAINLKKRLNINDV